VIGARRRRRGARGARGGAVAREEPGARATAGVRAAEKRAKPARRGARLRPEGGRSACSPREGAGRRRRGAAETVPNLRARMGTQRWVRLPRGMGAVGEWERRMVNGSSDLGLEVQREAAVLRAARTIVPLAVCLHCRRRGRRGFVVQLGMKWRMRCGIF
jgi:hypothetical protein